MEQILPDLKTFIIDYCEKYKVGQYDLNDLDLETSIDLDLDICGIEIDLFLAEFAETFRIDNSKFSWYKYGYPTGSIWISILKSLFGYRKKWVRRLACRFYKPRFKVQYLQDAIKTGKL
jgi:hypothetical protein